MAKKQKIYVIWGSLGVFLFGGFLASDYLTYQDNIDSTSCCGYVAPEWYKRPITHLLVSWTKPEWKPNGDNSQMWLVSDGLVNGKTEFWTIWDKSEN
ncbi:hypothetical protein [Vibrio fluvialis]|uniref:hypothetical protein n=1 Tax=Vibrio fluvialis TaxID=676 RepID=UPI0023A9FFB2|nr:hypothetical protein [Vibrio fluvialis]MDE5179116.1 hypothetical protein [Vibrio fluvialis]